jgi:hypothetical protein
MSRSPALARLIAAARQFRLIVRPTGGRGPIRGILAIGALGVVLSIAFYVGGATASSLYGEYGFHPDANESVARALTPAYSDVSLCVTCHAVEYRRLTSATHAGIGCESCHGPLAAHALASPGTLEAKVKVAVPTAEVCTKCHAAAVGRPAGFRQIVPANHYISACLQCHDPHTGISRRPPVVQHPLDHLPPCVTCHGPDGFKARDQRHPTVSGEDKVCLACHLVGRGPAEDQ